MIVYTITNTGNVWMLDESKGDTIPSWCVGKDGYHVVDTLPQNVQDIVDANGLIDARKAFIVARTKEVNELTVDIGGKVFNGDEVSQSRMVRAIVSAGIVGQTSTYWTLANNVSTLITLDELKEALGKSMQAMAAIWVQE